MVAVLCPCRVLGLVCPRVSQIASFRQLRSPPHRRGSGRGSSVILAQLVARSLDALVEGVPPTRWGRDDTPEHRPVSPGRGVNRSQVVTV